MSRVIDDDKKALKIINKWRSRVNGLNYTLHTDDIMLKGLRAEVPNWWDDIDPHDQDTWVECLAWDDEGDFNFRVLVKNRFRDSTGKYRFDVAMGSPYDHATPYLKPVGVK